VCPLEANRVSAGFAAIVEEAEVSGKKRWRSVKQEKKARVSLDSSCKSSALEGRTKHNLLASATVRVFDE